MNNINDFYSNINIDIANEWVENNLKKRISQLHSIQHNPELLLNCKFMKNEYPKMIKTISFVFGLNLHDIQDGIYGYTLIPFLKNKLGEEFTFTYNKNMYPECLRVAWNGYNLFYINIYSHTYYSAYIESIDSMMITINTTQKQIDYLTEELRRIESILSKQLLFSCKSIDDIFVALFKNKEAKKAINQKILDIKSLINEYEEHINRENSRALKRTKIESNLNKAKDKIEDLLNDYKFRKLN